MACFVNFPLSLTPRTTENFGSATPETLGICPYDKNHRVINRRLGDHIRKCRTNYEISKSKDGEVPLTVRCRYNMQHKVYAPELLRHEQWCSDKQTAWLERFYHQNVETLEAILRYDASATEHLPGSMANKNENSEKATEQDKVISQLLDEVFTKNLPVSHFGTSLDVTKLTHNLIAMVKDSPGETIVKGVLWPNPKISRPYDKFIRLGYVSQAQLISQTRDAEAFGFRRRKPLSRKPHTKAVVNLAKCKEEEDSDSDWDLDNNSSNKRFDWLQHVREQSQKGPSRIYPPGLTKAQRKQFDIDNSERLKFCEGIFVSYDEP